MVMVIWFRTQGESDGQLSLCMLIMNLYAFWSVVLCVSIVCWSRCVWVVG